jgi:NADH:ubiquinone oxidoreductase subunit E
MIETIDEKMNELKSYMESCKSKENSDSHLIGILHKAQGLYGYLSREVMDEISRAMNIPAAHIWGVATFYHFFNLSPRGKYVVSVCLGTACYVKGAQAVLDAIKGKLNIDIGETTEDKLFTLSEARCLGTCGLAPVVMINDKIYGNLTPKGVIELIQSYQKKV